MEAALTSPRDSLTVCMIWERKIVEIICNRCIYLVALVGQLINIQIQAQKEAYVRKSII